MIDFYPPEVLPERGEGPFLENDIARYLSLWTRFHDIIFGCQAPGWGAAGTFLVFFSFFLERGGEPAVGDSPHDSPIR